MPTYTMESAASLVRQLLGFPEQTVRFEQLSKDREELKREGLWMAALEQCSNGGERLPPEEKLEFVQAVAWELSCRTTLARMNSAASSQGLKLLVFKGISLAHSVYRPGQRSFGDVDIACANGSERQLIAFLTEQGGDLLDGEYPEVIFGQVRFDLHSRPLGQLADFLEPPGEPWTAQVRPLETDSPGIWVLAPEHEFLLALFHGAKHCFARANWIVDAAMLAYHSDATLLAAAVGRHRAGRHLWLAQQCLREWFGVELPEPLRGAVCPPRSWDLASNWLKNRVLARRAPEFLGMFTPLWAIASWPGRLRYLRVTLFPAGSGFRKRLSQLLRMLRTVLVSKKA